MARFTHHCADCNVTLDHADGYDIKRHNASAKHKAAVATNDAMIAKNNEAGAFLAEHPEYARPQAETLEQIADVIAPNGATRAKAIKAAKAKVAKAPATGTPAKACRVCTEIKPVTEFRAKSKAADGRDSLCAKCASEWDARLRAARKAAK